MKQILSLTGVCVFINAIRVGNNMKQNESDSELLKLAALACGYVINEARQRERELSGYSHVGLWLDNHTCWNPLADDEAAFRLMVKLNLIVDFNPVLNRAMVREYFLNDREWVEWVENGKNQSNALAATRRAIVRAAAEIGRRVKTVAPA